MVADHNLLKAARAAGTRLADAERRVVLARSDYHTAIRRLHLAGASLREIARALSMSHQRVQQVVAAAGGSWWKVWRSRSVRADATCTWCERPASLVPKLIAGPKVFICSDCVESAERVAGGGEESAFRRGRSGARDRCSFCSKRAGARRSLVVGRANVCDDCLLVCREILDGSST